MPRLYPLLMALVVLLQPSVSMAEPDPKVGSDAHALPPGEGKVLVAAQCSLCHSLALVTQNRADREGWRTLIRWMQKKHGLWELGELEAPILDYLENHYAPLGSGRRPPLAEHLLPVSARTGLEDGPP